MRKHEHFVQVKFLKHFRSLHFFAKSSIIFDFYELTIAVYEETFNEKRKLQFLGVFVTDDLCPIHWKWKVSFQSRKDRGFGIWTTVV